MTIRNQAQADQATQISDDELISMLCAERIKLTRQLCHAKRELREAAGRVENLEARLANLAASENHLTRKGGNE